MQSFLNFIGNLLLTLFLLAIIAIVLVIAFAIMTTLLGLFTLLLPVMGVGIFIIAAVFIILALFSP
ncbi:MAG: hypothetical protein K2N12_07375 [Helicobacter sp.]|nr:hypothetical protein [Helicobacter sp.]